MKYYVIFKNGRPDTMFKTLNDSRKYCKKEVTNHKRTVYTIWKVIETSGKPKMTEIGDVYHSWTILYLNLEEKKNYKINNDGTLGRRV